MFEEKPIILSEQMLGLSKRLSALPDSAESLNIVNILANFQKVLFKKPNVFELGKTYARNFCLCRVSRDFRSIFSWKKLFLDPIWTGKNRFALKRGGGVDYTDTNYFSLFIWDPDICNVQYFTENPLNRINHLNVTMAGNCDVLNWDFLFLD